MPRLLLTGGHGMVGQNIKAHHQAKSWEIFAPTSTGTRPQGRAIGSSLHQGEQGLMWSSTPRVVSAGIQANMAPPSRFFRRKTT